MFALFYTFLLIDEVKKRIHVLAKPQWSSLRIHLCASERYIFGVFNSFTVKKVNFFTINVKFKVILSSKSWGGGEYLYKPSSHPKFRGGTSLIPPPPPPRIYASVLHNVCFILHLSLDRWCQEKNTCTGKTTMIESQNTFVCERAERASDFWSFYYFYS